MKKCVLGIIVMLMLVMCMAFGVSADLVVDNPPDGFEFGSCGEQATYLFNKETGELIISGSGAIDRMAFTWDWNIKSVVIRDGITAIGEQAFSWASNLVSISLSDSVKSIESGAFSHCVSLTDINIPNGVTSFGSGVFNTCLSLPNVSIGDNITVIDGLAFRQCASLTYMNLGDNVKRIGSMAFADCVNLKTVYITDSVAEIEEKAFEDSAVTDIYYGGTEEQWKKIDIGENDFENITVHFGRSFCSYHNNMINVAETDATCTESGYTDGRYCQDCENWISGHNLIRKKLHKDSEYDGVCDICKKNATDLWLGENEVWTFAGYESEYRFIPNYSGEYTFVLENAQNISVYDVENSFEYYSGDWELDVELEKGKTYLISINKDDSFCVDNLKIYFNCEHNEYTAGLPAVISACSSIENYTSGTYCYVCERWFSGHKLIPVSMHSDSNIDGVCDVCNKGYSNIKSNEKFEDNNDVYEYEGHFLFIPDVTGYYTYDYDEYKDQYGIIYDMNLTLLEKNDDDLYYLEKSKTYVLELQYNEYYDDNKSASINLIEAADGSHVHSHKSTDFKEPTHTQEGYIVYTCDCGDSYTETLPVTASENKATNIKAEYDYETFEDVPQMVVIENGKNANFVFEGIYENYKSFDIFFEIDGEKVQPNGSVTVKIPVPTGFNHATISVYYVEANGNKTKIESKYENGYIVFETDHFSEYVLVDESSEIDPTADCSCNCHKSGFMGFIWKILRIFYKLFKINPVCGCGIAHY